MLPLTHLILLASLIVPGKGLAKTSLGVFIPVTMDNKLLEKQLNSDPAFKDFEVEVFSRFTDFEFSSTQKTFSLAILPAAYHRYFKDLKPIGQFMIEGKSELPFEVLSIEADWDLKRIKDGSVGVIDEVGTKNTNTYVKEVLDDKNFKRIKRAAKAEDLYPMLALGNADYILMSPYNWKMLKSRIDSQPKKVLETRAVRLPILFQDVKSQHSYADLIGKVESKTLKMMGFDALANYKD